MVFLNSKYIWLHNIRIMKQFAKLHFSFLLALSGLLIFTLTACGVRGPLYLPPPPSYPQKPTQEEPVGIQYPSKPTTPPKESVKP
jgi:predicted small lipoprotein YifL